MPPRFTIQPIHHITCSTCGQSHTGPLTECRAWQARHETEHRETDQAARPGHA